MGDTPFMYWVGMDTSPEATADDVAAFNDFYSNVHAHEVIAANPGFRRVMRYELLEPDPRGDFGPRWLAIYEIDSEAGARAYLERDAGLAEAKPKYTEGRGAWHGRSTRWRMVWQRIAPAQGELGGGAPYLYFVGMNVPPDTDAKGLQDFDRFYTNTHVPEVVSVSKFLTGTRYELYRGLVHPEPGAPRFLAAYEADEGSLKTRAERAANPGAFPALSSGPPAWEAHDTLWRLLYRRIFTWEA
jgi:hypothetical protein